MPTQKTQLTKTTGVKAKAVTKPKATAKTTKTKTTKTIKAAPKKAKAPKKATPAQAKSRKESTLLPTIPKPRVVVGFVDFLREQSVVGLAVGLVIGAQVKALADQLINSFINPLLGLVLPGSGSLSNKVFTVHVEHKTAIFGWGAFMAVLLSFTTTAAVVYFVFKALKLDTLTKKKDK